MLPVCSCSLCPVSPPIELVVWHCPLSDWEFLLSCKPQEVWDQVYHVLRFIPTYWWWLIHLSCNLSPECHMWNSDCPVDVHAFLPKASHITTFKSILIFLCLTSLYSVCVCISVCTRVWITVLFFFIVLSLSLNWPFLKTGTCSPLYTTSGWHKGVQFIFVELNPAIEVLTLRSGI